MWLGIAAAGHGGCSGAELFQCLQDEQCSGGICTLRGVCAFEDDDCESGFRYGEHASVLTGTCVPVDAGSTGMEEPPGSDGGAEASGVGESGLPPDGTSGQEPEGSESSDGAVDDSPPSSEVLFVDSSTRDFQAGEHLGTVWGGEDVELLEGNAGAFRSRVFDAGEPAWWGELAWVAGGVYGEPLPGGGGAGQRLGGLQSQNILLLRMDEAGMLWDQSGLAQDLEPSGGEDAMPVEGRFGAALSLSGDSHWSRVLEPGDPMTMSGDDGFTWSLWIRSDDDCNDGGGHTANQVYMGVRGHALMWFGCRGPNSTPCSAQNATGRAGLHFQRTDGEPARLCGESTIADGDWHHLAVVNDAGAGSTIRLFVDGVVEGEVGGASVVVPRPGDELTIGRYDDGYEAQADLDEVAMWSRALSGEEIAGLYERGRRALRVRAYACEALDCEPTEEEKGPFTEPQEGMSLSIPAFKARYVRYEVMLERDDESAESPAFSRFEVSAPQDLEDVE